jgi:hypothetical protein
MEFAVTLYRQPCKADGIDTQSNRMLFVYHFGKVDRILLNKASHAFSAGFIRQQCKIFNSATMENVYFGTNFLYIVVKRIFYIYETYRAVTVNLEQEWSTDVDSKNKIVIICNDRNIKNLS